MRVLSPPELGELWTVVSCHMGAWELNPDPLEEHSVRLNVESSHQPPQVCSKLKELIVSGVPVESKLQ